MANELEKPFSSSQHALEIGARALAHVEKVHAELSTLRDLVAELRQCKTQAEQAESAPRQLPRGTTGNDALERRLSEAEARCKSLETEHEQIRDHNASLMNLYVASYRLHDAIDQDEVISVIQEVVANLVGSEQLGVFELSPDGQACALIGSCGLDTQKYESIPTRGGLIEEIIRSGETLVVGEAERARALPHERSMTVCVPLQLRGVVMGALVIFDLLPQKRGLTSIDRELFNLLSTHAATSLYCLSSNARAGGRAHSAQRPADSLLP